jgi:ferredoxin
MPQAITRTLRRPLARVEAGATAIYGSRYNPLHHSGTIVVALLLVLLITGLYLLVFYRIGAPYESTLAITEQVWTGRWIRSLHRFASDAGVIAIVVHALKMFLQGRTWGPRALAWITGCLLLIVFMVAGWTGYVLVWDVQAQVMAVEGARFLDVLPILSEPLGRTFVGERAIPSAFFFMNLFLHVALPMAMGLLLWLHTARLSRPALLPPRPVLWGVIGVLTLVSVVWPIGMAPQADLFRLEREAPYDLFFSFWIPLARAISPLAGWALLGFLVVPLIMVPYWARPKRESRLPPSVVDERLCTGCEQCAKDCPYEAITMLERTDGRAKLVARVDPDLCVSCGICAGSCAPMVVGPPTRTGRDQLAAVKRFIAQQRPGPAEVVVVGCTNGAGGVTALERIDGAHVLPIRCVGSLHTSVVEYLIRGGAGGVMIASCPEHDCRNREGSKWLEARLFAGREAELQERVDRRRVRWIQAGEAERGVVLRELRSFRRSLPGVTTLPEAEIDILALCERGTAEGEGPVEEHGLTEVAD